jgi:L-ornithine Nalpha-acyltransferase
MPNILASKSGFIARLADSRAEREAAQRLRNLIFKGTDHERDEDSFDARCDHLLVIATAAETSPPFQLDDGELVGTYRLLRHPKGTDASRFYAAKEFDIAPLLARKADLAFLELGRSCVRQDMRDQPVAELLWQGIWNYVRHHRMDVMIGCASLAGTDPEVHAGALSYLAHRAPAPEDWHVSAVPSRHVAMKPDSPGNAPASPDERSVLRSLPPLIKGYLRLGCHVGEGAVIDHEFNTTDVLIILPVASINPRYFKYFGAPLA